MAKKKSSSKRTERVAFDFSIDSKTSKNAKKSIKRAGKSALIVIIVFLIIGLAIGGGLTYYFTKTDCFELIGSDEITLTTDEVYFDQGVKVISFGKDMSSKVKVETDLVQNKDGSYSPSMDSDGTYTIGTYYIVYSVDCLKYGTIFKVEKVRLINFVEPSDDDVVDEFEEVNNG